MGCDIHLYVEARCDEARDDSGKWQRIVEPYTGEYYGAFTDGPAYWYIGRNYELFGLLAGVRDQSIEPLSEPRGLPADVSESIAAEYSGADAGEHSASWLYFEELEDVDWYEPYGDDEDDYRWGDFAELVIEPMRKLAEECGSKRAVRIVFWFDS